MTEAAQHPFRKDPQAPVKPDKLALHADRLSLSFGGLKAVSDFTVELPLKGLYGLIGPNGAGKTTVFNLLTGVYKPDQGAVYLGSERIDGRKPSFMPATGSSRSSTLGSVASARAISRRR